MNEKRIQEVIDIEKQAEAILLAARTEADRLPLQAEADAQEILTEARAAAERDARQMVEQARADDQTGTIMAAADNRIRESELLAANHLEEAIRFVLDRVIGKA